MRVFRADLHIHTCLSPCAEPEMRPSAIAAEAVRKGLDLIATCDHNSAENVAAGRAAAARAGLACLGGIEITSREEVHILGLFDGERGARAMQGLVYAHLPGANDPVAFGEQWLVDAEDRVIGESGRLLIGATELTVEEVVGAIHEAGGIAVASHVDRPRFSILSQLGFIPEDLALDAVELSGPGALAAAAGRPALRASDAHRLEEIGTRHTALLLEAPTLAEVRLALRDTRGRKVVAN